MNPFYKNLALWCVIVLMMIMLYKMFDAQNIAESPLGYSEFLAMVEENRIAEVTLQGQELTAIDSGNRK
ncbi:MAG: cell division protein FtsH, partial [Desulfatitalea sp.]|nr:cell division protein FtsH [Desulfatitalea sp.]